MSIMCTNNNNNISSSNTSSKSGNEGRINQDALRRSDVLDGRSTELLLSLLLDDSGRDGEPALVNNAKNTLAEVLGHVEPTEVNSPPEGANRIDLGGDDSFGSIGFGIMDSVTLRQRQQSSQRQQQPPQDRQQNRQQQSGQQDSEGSAPTMEDSDDSLSVLNNDSFANYNDSLASIGFHDSIDLDRERLVQNHKHHNKHIASPTRTHSNGSLSSNASNSANGTTGSSGSTRRMIPTFGSSIRSSLSLKSLATLLSRVEETTEETSPTEDKSSDGSNTVDGSIDAGISANNDQNSKKSNSNIVRRIDNATQSNEANDGKKEDVVRSQIMPLTRFHMFRRSCKRRGYSNPQA